MASGSGRMTTALVGLTLSTFTFITAETLPIGLLPLIGRDLAVTPSEVGLLVSAYAVVVVVATIPLTRLTARVPRRLLLTVVLLVLVAGTAASTAAPGYGLLLAARVLTALSHSVFWAIVVPIAASLAEQAARGRAVSTVYAGGSVATVLGIPFGTWLGQTVDWRAAFIGTSALGAISLGIVARSLPSVRGPRPPATRGSSPDRRGYVLLVLTTAVMTTGALSAFTYISPFLTDVSGVAPAAVGAVLLVRGTAGLVAVLAVGRLVDRSPRATTLVALAVQVVGLGAQALGGPVPPLGLIGAVLAGASFAAFSAALGARVLIVAPGSTDAASAGTSTAFNVGIASGAVVGAAALPVVGLAGVPVVAGVLVAAGLVLLIVEARLGDRAAPR